MGTELVGHLLLEVLDRARGQIDLVVEPAVDLQRPLEGDGAKRDLAAGVAGRDGRGNGRGRSVERGRRRGRGRARGVGASRLRLCERRSRENWCEQGRGECSKTCGRHHCNGLDGEPCRSPDGADCRKSRVTFRRWYQCSPSRGTGLLAHEEALSCDSRKPRRGMPSHIL